MSSKLIPIGREKVSNNVTATPTKLTSVNKTNYNDVVALIHIECEASFTDKLKVMRYGYGTDTIDATNGLHLGNNDVFELSSIEQIEAFKFITLEDQKAVTLQVQYYHKIG